MTSWGHTEWDRSPGPWLPSAVLPASRGENRVGWAEGGARPPAPVRGSTVPGKGSRWSPRRPSKVTLTSLFTS